ncbi:MAG: hypothetical protein KDC90_07445 [Ignavibacteriae bacterium]|nr:hypothetical protein [Ignavibacteriota bacterium]
MNTQQLFTQLGKLQHENALMKTLATPGGFFRYYFEQLPYYKTVEDCFNAINKTYFELFGEYRHIDYSSFRNSRTHWLRS